MKVQLFAVSVTLLVFGALQVNGFCPNGTQAIEEITSCHFQILAAFTKSPIIATELNNYCNSSARTTEIQCPGNPLNKCRRRSPTAREVLNINGIRESMKIMCNSVQILVGKQDCIGRYRSSVVICIAIAMPSYYSSVQQVFPQIHETGKGFEWVERKSFKALCRYFDKIAKCLRTFGQNCGREIGDIFDAQILAVTPPVCSKIPTLSTRLPVVIEGSSMSTTPPFDFDVDASTPRFNINGEPRLRMNRKSLGGSGMKQSANFMLFISLTFVAIVKGIM